MPLCSVEIPRGAAPETIEKARNLAIKSLETIRERLGVPPSDLETNVVEGNGGQTKLLVTYTVGPEEYPKDKFPERDNPAFDPTAEQVDQAGKEVQANAAQGELNVSQTTFEAWANTTFILRDQNALEPTLPPEDLKETGLHIKNPQIRLIVSPKKQQKPTTLPPEAEPTAESEPNLQFISEVGKKLAEVLGLPEKPPIPIHVQPTLFADTDFAVEFDCQPTAGHQISEAVRTYMARLIEQELNQNPSTKDGSAEVWVRQGQPDKHYFVG